MEPLSALRPKPLLPVLGRLVIEHQLALMHAAGIRDVVVVVGRNGDEIAAALGDGAAHGVRIRYVAQDRPRGIAHAVGTVEPVVDRPFLLVLGDVFFVSRDLSPMFAMLEEGHGGVLAAVDDADGESIERNFAIVRDSTGRVTRVIEKPRHPPTRLKGTGVYLFDVAFFDAIRRTPRSALRDEYELTDAIQIFIDDGHRVGVAEVVTEDVNLTVPRDLWALNLRELDRSGQALYVDPSAQVDPGAALTRSVIGPGAVIGAVRVVDSVVFAGARVEADAVRSIVTTSGRIAFDEAS
jgi:dTDP-glucose pyrophosphorylase